MYLLYLIRSSGEGGGGVSWTLEDAGGALRRGWGGGELAVLRGRRGGSSLRERGLPEKGGTYRERTTPPPEPTPRAPSTRHLLRP